MDTERLILSLKSEIDYLNVKIDDLEESLQNRVDAIEQARLFDFDNEDSRAVQFMAKLTAAPVDGAYAWHEVQWDEANAQFMDVPDGERWDSDEWGNAVEANGGLSAPVNSYVLMQIVITNEHDVPYKPVFEYGNPGAFIAEVVNDTADSTWDWTRKDIDADGEVIGSSVQPLTGTAYEINGIEAPSTGSYSFLAYIHTHIVGGNTVYTFAFPIPGCSWFDAYDVLRVSADGVPEWGCVRVQ